MSITEKVQKALGEEYETFYLYAEKKHCRGALAVHFHGENSQGVCESRDRQQSKFALRMFLYNLLGHVYASIDDPPFPPTKTKNPEETQ